MSLPCCDVCWSMVCDCGIYRPSHLLFDNILLRKKQLVNLLKMCSSCRVTVRVKCLFLAVTYVGLWTAIVVFTGHLTCFLQSSCRGQQRLLY